MYFILILISSLAFNCKTKQQASDPPATGIDADIIVDRPDHYPGFVPTSTINQRGKSKYHTATPELNRVPKTNQKSVFVVKPSLGGWQNIPFEDSAIKYYLMTPGNYVSWGPLEITASGKSGTPKVIMYYDPKSMGDQVSIQHAYDTDKENRAAIIEGIQVGDKRNRSPESFITFSGLTLKGQSWTKGDVKAGSGIFITPGSSDIRIVNCYSWKWRGARMYGSRIVFQDNVVAGNLRIRGDHGGVGIYTTKEYGSYDCRIVGNEIFDQNNLIGVPKDGKDATTYKFTNGTVIADNDLYYTEDSRVTVDGKPFCCGGSAIDVKNGSSDPKKPLLITGNRIAYIYPSPPDKSCGDNNGKLGEGIILHKDARNTVISDNIFHEVSRGVMIYPGTNRDMLTENVLIKNNLFHTVRNQLPDITGFAFHSAAGKVNIVWNTVINAKGFARAKINKKIDIRGNRYIGAQIEIPVSKKQLTVDDNYVSTIPDLDLSDLSIQWHRHTGYETLVIPACVAEKSQLETIRKKYPQSRTKDYMRERGL